MTAALSPHRWSIRAKSVTLVAGYLLALCAVYSAFTVYLVRREVGQAQDRFQQTAHIVAAELDAYVESGQQRLATVTRLPGMAYGLRTIQEAHGGGYIPPWTTLHYLFFRSPVFTGGVFLLDRTGTVLWTEPPGLPWLGKRLDEYAPVATRPPNGGSAISGAVLSDTVLNRPHVVAVAPILNASGEIDGILGGVIDLAASEFTDTLRATSTADGRFVDVVDQNGLVVASTSAPRLFQSSGALSRDAEPLMLSSANLVHAPWRVVAGQPRAAGLAEVRRLQRLLFGLGAGLLAIAIAAGAPLINGFVRSIKGLTDAAEVMAGGDLSQPVVISRRHDELATLAQTFEQMRAELERSRQALEQRLEEREELIRLKEEFLAGISHELRTPLNAILGYTEMLVDEPLTPEGQELLATVRAQSEHLFQLLSDLLTLSVLNVGKVTLQVGPIRVPSILARIAPAAEQLGRGKDIELVWDCPASVPTIETDGLRLEQVLTNLITNAIKFTPRGRVTIRVHYRADTQRVVFEVTDTGVGIPADQIPHIFDEFRQVDGSYSRAYGGVGLGLALVKKLTALLQGDVRVVSEVANGSTFTVTVPLRANANAMRSAA